MHIVLYFQCPQYNTMGIESIITFNARSIQYMLLTTSEEESLCWTATCSDRVTSEKPILPQYGHVYDCGCSEDDTESPP